MWKFYKAVLGSALKEFWAATDGVLSGIAVLSFFAILLSRKYGERIVTTWNGISPWWSVIPIGLLVSWRLLKANYMQFASVKAERDALLGTTVLAEEDPKIYFDPVNEELRNTGTIPFELSNKGQRVNMAHRITVLPIPALPSVTFEYVDHLDMAERKQLLPIVSPAGRDIVAELTRAWQNAGNPLGTEFRFEIKLTYEDVSRTRKFETTVQLTYFPEEANKAKAPAAPGFWKERLLIKVNDTAIRRLS